MKTTIKFCMILICLFNLSSCVSQKIKKDQLTFNYVGFQKDTLIGSVTLVFEIINNSNDTLFFPSNNIHLEVKKSNEVLKDYGCDGFFFKKIDSPELVNYLKNWENQEKTLYTLKYSFSEKVFQKSYGDNKLDQNNRDEITQNIFNRSIFILPKQKIINLQYFCNDDIDEHCSIISYYEFSKDFFYKYDNLNNKIEHELKY